MWNQRDRARQHAASILHFVETDTFYPMWIKGCMAFCHSITYTSLTNSSASVEHVYTVFFPFARGNKHFTTITAFTCKQCLADVCTAIVMNSFGLGGHIGRKRGRMWQNVSSAPLPECSFNLLSVSSFSSCAAVLHQPTQRELQENKSVAATRGKKSVKRQFHICGQKSSHSSFPLQSVGLQF